ncbi:MAG: iron-containing alcohol dehydrogenase [Polyangiaceae bacterium]
MLSKDGFELHPGPRTVFGVGSVDKLAKRVRVVGSGRACVVSDAGLVAAGIVAQVVEQLRRADIDVVEFTEVESNPRRRTVERAAKTLSGDKNTLVVALGGGSVIDAAKAIALAAPNKGNLDSVRFGTKPAQRGLRVVCIPTTAGTGSETNMFGVITDPEIGRKVLVAHPSVLPELVILDPMLTVGLPPEVTALTGLDALTHALESLMATRANPVSEALALRAMAMVFAHLERAFSDGDDLEARSQMLCAAHVAGLAFSSSGLGVCHALGHPLSARLDSAHGQALATLLPHVLRFHLDVCEAKLAQAAIAFGVFDDLASAADNAAAAVAAVERLSRALGADKTGSELGIEESMIPTLVEDALADPLILTTPKPVTPEILAQIYRDAS